MNKFTDNPKGGYTIIETMIAISLFLIIAIFGTAALVNANLIYRKAQSMRSILNSLNFAMEDMSRSIKTGYNYHCALSGQTSLPTTPRSCSAGIGIAFEAPGGRSGDNTVNCLNLRTEPRRLCK
jgi:type II secretory pathway pseudopilin PulG